MKTLPLILLLLVVTLAPCAVAEEPDLINPDRPGIADGSAVISRGRFQIETGLERDHDDGGHSIATPLLLRYGVTDHFEFRAETNGYVHAPGGSGFAPLSVGGKYHFGDTPSLGVIARIFVPSGTGAQRSHATTGDVRLAMDLSFGEKWSLNPNIGFASQDDGAGRFTAGLAAMTLQYNISDHLNLFVDGAAQTPEERGGTASVILDAGGALIIGRDTQLDASIGWGAHGSTPPAVFLAVGISRRF